MAAIAAVIGRILLGALFVFAGFGKVMDPAGTAQYMESMSPFPGTMALGVGIFEIVAGLVLASGFMTRIAALALIGFTALATLFFHSQVTDPMQAAMALKNLAIIGGLLLVIAYAQVRHTTALMDERGKRHDAEVRAAHAEGRAEALAAAPVAAAPVAAAGVAGTHTRTPLDRDGDGVADRHEGAAHGATGIDGTHPRTAQDRDGDGVNDLTGRDAPGTHPRRPLDRDGDGHLG